MGNPTEPTRPTVDAGIYLRWPGQVPHGRVDDGGLTRMPPRQSPLAVLQHNEPRPTPAAVVRSLGMPLAQEQSWMKFLREEVPKANVVAWRSALVAKAKADGMNPELRSVLLQRTSQYAQSLVKADVCTVVSLEDAWAALRAVYQERLGTVEELEKGEARGGDYYKRVPRPGGGYRYFYDEDKYQGHDGAHVGGEEAKAGYLDKRIAAAVEGAGDRGILVSELQALAAKHGAGSVADRVRNLVQAGKLHFQSGRLFQKPPKPAN